MPRRLFAHAEHGGDLGVAHALDIAECADRRTPTFWERRDGVLQRRAVTSSNSSWASGGEWCFSESRRCSQQILIFAGPVNHACSPENIDRAIPYRAEEVRRDPTVDGPGGTVLPDVREDIMDDLLGVSTRAGERRVAKRQSDSACSWRRSRRRQIRLRRGGAR